MVTSNNKFNLLILLCALVIPGRAQQKYWIQLKDKNGTPFSLNSPSAFLSERSIQRRNNFHIQLDRTDLPVTPDYVAAIAGVPNVKVLFASKWLNGIVIKIDSVSKAPAALNAISQMTFVSSTNRTMRYVLHYKEPSAIQPMSSARTSRSTYMSTGFSYGGSHSQVTQLNVNCLHDKGFRGQGMIIAVMDVGFDNVDKGALFDSLRNEGRLLGTRDFVNGTPNAFYGGDHGSNVLSCMAAISPGHAMGTAPKASYWLLKTEDGPSETISEEYNWIRGAEFADSLGADVLTTSLGYTEFDNNMNNHTWASLNGRTAPMSIAATAAARKGMFVLNAAGNEGDGSWKYVSVPGDADSICTVGAVDTTGIYAPFSSIGPTADKRIKPDLVAAGWGAYICNVDCDFTGNGTSFATPILAGAVTCFWQAHHSYNNIQVLDTLKKYSSQAGNPNNRTGWGIPDMCKPPIPIPKNDPLGVYAYLADDQQVVIKVSNTEITYLRISVNDLLGRNLLNADLDPKSNTIHWPMYNIADGIYILKIETSAGNITRKIVH